MEVKEKSKLDMVIDDMTVKAGEAALSAWAEVVKKGAAGSLKLPESPNVRTFVRMWFLAAYAMALLDHTMNSVERMKEAGDADQGKREGLMSRMVKRLVS